MVRLVPGFVSKPLLGVAAYSVWYSCVLAHKFLKAAQAGVQRPCKNRKTVLVTTGRQAKTLHIVRALKEQGCRVIVSDYQSISASAVSTACDGSATLLPLDTNRIFKWVEHLEQIIVRESVDMVIPVCTINEALFVGVAKDWLQQKLPHVHFMCEGLEKMAQLDNKDLFVKMCVDCGVPVPDSGLVTCPEDLKKIPFSEMDVIIKRIESSVNRTEEIKIVRKGCQPPVINATEDDPWQWQRFIKGEEYSAWFVCIDGRVTFEGCYKSLDDLLYFDGLAVPAEVSAAIEKFISVHKLTGQYAFDYFVEASTGEFFVIECNPRASSVLEGVSKTPGWGACFFGQDVRPQTIYGNTGFWFHRNCWPFVSGRQEGFFSWTDPLPVIVAELAWPMELLRMKAVIGGWLTRKPENLPQQAGRPISAVFPSFCEYLGFNYHHVDVNIGKIIVPGPTVGRDYAKFQIIQDDPRGTYVRAIAEQDDSACRVLTDSAEVAEMLRSSKVEITRLVDGLEAAEAQGNETLLVGNQNTILQLGKTGSMFDAILVAQDACEMAKSVLAPQGRMVSVEALPKAVA
mmetsp:Transcript_45709/g.99227  ORF Transcript_45709/g.99227 Transcript_45709/m.99227 type:complete len:570 (+) Transcript_45709:28-1737(+)